jgi:hypothetical protein
MQNFPGQRGQSDLRNEPSNCVLLENMFEPLKVDLKKDPYFFIEIKEQVNNVCMEWGRVEKVYIEQNSPGHVFIKFGGATREKAMASAEATVRNLNGKTFDDRPISARFMSE